MNYPDSARNKIVRQRFCDPFSSILHTHQPAVKTTESERRIPSIPPTPALPGARTLPPIGLRRFLRARGRVARCRHGWPPVSTTCQPTRVPGPKGAQRGPVVEAVFDNRFHLGARRQACAPRRDDRNPRDAHHPHHAYQWWPWDRKNLLYREKGENVFPTAHGHQNAYHRYHAYQLVTESVRLSGEETRSDPYHDFGILNWPTSA